jgi:hypothetical protein
LVLHSGTGPINLGVFIAPTATPGDTVAFVGPVMSYYEHVTTNFRRLTDNEWRTLYAQAPSFRPSWVNVYLADNSGNPRGTGLVLPIQLASFTARIFGTQGMVRLDWSTRSELNNYGFEVQKSDSTQLHYHTIPHGFVAGHGTTNEPQSYTCVDSTAGRGRWFYRLKQIDLDGTVHWSDGIEARSATDVHNDAPTVFAITQNYPNPFNSTTIIGFSIPFSMTGERTELKIFDVQGRLDRTQINEKIQQGNYLTRWDGLNDGGAPVASGVYFYRLDVGSASISKKLVMIK